MALMLPKPEGPTVGDMAKIYKDLKDLASDPKFASTFMFSPAYRSGKSAMIEEIRRSGKGFADLYMGHFPVTTSTVGFEKAKSADEIIHDIKVIKHRMVGIDPLHKPTFVVVDELSPAFKRAGESAKKLADAIDDMTYSAISGKATADDFNWFNGEPDRKIDLDLMATYADPKYPDATVTLRQERLSKRDPRNPNPAAPPGYSFFLYVNGRRSNRGFNILKLAKVQAEELHKRLVKGLRDAENATISELPNYGRFA